MGIKNFLDKELSLEEVKNIYPEYIGKIGNGFKDETGNEYGKLRVLYRTENQGKIASWVCQCECGNYTKVRGNHLRGNKIISCGCIQRETARKTREATVNNEEIFNNKFGKLTPLYYNGYSRTHDRLVHCLCDCGNECDVNLQYLRIGDTKSCGCLGNSYGEYEVESFLKRNNYNYKKEYSFNDLRDKYLLRFDFAIFDDNEKIKYLIEYDGPQHSDPQNKFFSLTLLQHDNMKNDYCKINNISLLRIKYKENIEKMIKQFEREEKI